MNEKCCSIQNQVCNWASVSEPRNSKLKGGFLISRHTVHMAYGNMPYVIVYSNMLYVMAYSSMPYVGMALKKNGGNMTRLNVCVRLVKDFHGPYQALSNASMGNKTINFAGESISKVPDRRVAKTGWRYWVGQCQQCCEPPIR